MEELNFAGRGVQVLKDYHAILKTCGKDLDMIVVPTPVSLHAEMHKTCVEAGLPVYLEKPPTLNYAELMEMMAVESKARRETFVGFNFIVEKPRRALKRRILDGDFGAVKRVAFTGLWPRLTTYFQRASWAGRLILDGKLVLDFAMGNAMAHYLYNLLFWAGSKELLSWAAVQEVEAQLYRAHRIEGADTAFVKVRLEGGIELRGVFSHACNDAVYTTREEVFGERGTIVWNPKEGYRVDKGAGGSENIAPEKVSLLQENHREYFRYLRSEVERPLIRLVDCVPFVQICDLTYIAAGQIHPIPDKYIERQAIHDDRGTGESVNIIGLSQAAQNFTQSGAWPEAPAVPWAKAGGKASLKDLPSLPAVIARMAASSACQAGN
jgi:predicted dehydrogenase